MKNKILLLLFISISSVSLVCAQGVWKDAFTSSWTYNLGAKTGAGEIGGAGYTGTATTVSIAPSTAGFMPIPPSGKVKLANKNTSPVGEAEWYLVDYSAASALKFVSSISGRVAKFSMYDIESATSVAGFFHRITFEENSAMSEMDWLFAVGRTNGSSNQINNENSGIPVSPSTQAFPDFFTSVRWQIPAGSPTGTNPEFRYAYKGVPADGETAGTTYERILNGINFIQGGTYDMEFYCNNAAEEKTYVRNSVTYTLPSNTMHVWANGTQLTANIGGNATPDIPGYNLARNAKLDACVFVGQRSSASGSTKHAVSYIQNIQINHIADPLLSFTAVDNGSSALLEWSTTPEQNDLSFDILRKTGISEFQAVGQVAGNGISTDTKSYAFTDENALPGTNYYQLRHVDTDGNYSYSETLSVTIPRNQDDLRVSGLTVKYVYGRLLFNWHTFAEEDNGHFRIMVSSNGASWHEAGRVDTKAENGNSDVRLEYEYRTTYSSLDLAGISVVLVLFLVIIGLSRRNRRLIMAAAMFTVVMFFANCNKKNSIGDDLLEGGKIYVKVQQFNTEGTMTDESDVLEVEIKN